MVEREGHLRILPAAGWRLRRWLIHGMAARLPFISRCNDQKSSTFCSANADHDPSHRIVSSGVNSVHDEAICPHRKADMARISDWHHHLSTRRQPTAGVAFSGKFWSMQLIAGKSHLVVSSVVCLPFQSENGESRT
jgi:hypothetical protein